MRRDPGPQRHLHVLVTALTAWVQRGCSEPNQSVCMENPSVPRRGGKRGMQEGGRGGGHLGLEWVPTADERGRAGLVNVNI